MSDIIIVGAGKKTLGNIASEIRRQAEEGGHHLAAIVGRNFIEGRHGRREDIGLLDNPSAADQYLRPCLNPDTYVFLTISTEDEGLTAYRYIKYFHERGMYVITTEKGALAYHYGDLACNLGMLGFRAVVGGGTDMIGVLRRRHLQNKEVLAHLFVNGTLNFIFYRIAVDGKTLAEATQEAIDKGYSEPGASTPSEVVTGELGDIQRKLSVLFNLAFAHVDGPTLWPGMFKSVGLSGAGLQEFALPGVNYRFVTRITNRGVKFEGAGSQGSMHAEVNGWHIDAGFVELKANTQLARRAPDDVNNGGFIEVGPDGRLGSFDLVKGPGAGKEVTAAAAMADFDDFIARRAREAAMLQRLRDLAERVDAVSGSKG